MNRSPYPIPDRSDFTGPNEVILHIDPSQTTDSLGRTRFMAFWQTDQPWVPNGVRGQVFRANIADFTDRAKRRGETVRVPLPPTGGAR